MILDKIVKLDFPQDHYFPEVHQKRQIVLHHTVSGRGVKGDIDWWLSDTQRVATCIIVHADGTPYQLFPSNCWAHHLGVKAKSFEQYGIRDWNNTILNQQSIGIEIDSWGGLVESSGKWYPAKWDKVTNMYVPRTDVKPVQDVQRFPNQWRGFYGFEKYTEEQIRTVEELLQFWHGRYSIPLDYQKSMFHVNAQALSGVPGVWAHASYRGDKSDIYPDPELIQMLKAL